MNYHISLTWLTAVVLFMTMTAAARPTPQVTCDSKQGAGQRRGVNMDDDSALIPSELETCNTMAHDLRLDVTGCVI